MSLHAACRCSGGQSCGIAWYEYVISYNVDDSVTAHWDEHASGGLHTGVVWRMTCDTLSFLNFGDKESCISTRMV